MCRKRLQTNFNGGGDVSDDCQIVVMDGANAVIGKKVYLGKGCRIFVRKDFCIGSYTLLADNVSIYDHKHRCTRGTNKIK